MLLVAACGGGELSPVAYEQRLGDAELAAALESDHPDTLREAADELDDVDPPEGASEDHDELVDALRALADEREDEGNGDDLFADEDEHEEGDAEERVERALAELSDRGYDVGTDDVDESEDEDPEEEEDED